VALGGDPGKERRAARLEAKVAPRTFDDLANSYFEACEAGEWKPKGKLKKAAVLQGERERTRLHVRPVLGAVPYREITRLHVKALLRGMKAKGIGVQTNLTQAIIRQIFNYAISDDLVQVNPATGFSPFADRVTRSRIWSDAETRALWSALDDPAELRGDDGGPIHVGEGVRIAIKLLLLLGQRRGEVIGMERRELDLAARTWLIGAARTKGSRPHMVPLPPAAIPLIRRAMFLSDFDRDEPSDFVFSTSHKIDRPIRPASVTHALARLKEGLRISEPTIHDLRRTVSTNLTSERCGVSPFIRSKVLGHIDAGGGAMVSAVHYDANTYLAEKRRALEIWSELLDDILSCKSAARQRSARI
jgi:integrase